MEALQRFVDGVWLSTESVRFLGLRLTATMTVLRLADETLLIHSPVLLTPERREAVDALGPVMHLYSPNLYHHLRIGEWARAYPAARLHAPRGLGKKRPDLKIDRTHGSAPEPVFRGVIEELPIEGFRLRETVLYYAPARTLVVADLVHNVGVSPHFWTRVYTTAMGFHDRVALSRMIRWTAFSDGAAARRSLNEVLARPFERLVVGHGAPLEVNPKGALVDAYRWLPEQPPG